jgi:hypothetical protein
MTFNPGDNRFWVQGYPPRLVWGTWESGDSWLEVFSVRILRNVLFLLAFPATIADYLWRWRTADVPPQWWAEVWVTSLLLLASAALGLSARPVWFAFPVALYVLVDNASVLASKITAPIVNRPNGESPVRSHPRVLMLTLLNAAQVIVAFGVLMLLHREGFMGLHSPMQALYLSALTFTTLGYGDITPADSYGRALVVAELAFFVLILATALPQALAPIRTRETDGGEAE